MPGGLSKTISISNQKFELGPHIYFDKDNDVIDFWKKYSKGELISCNRSNRIFFDGKFIKSPFSVVDTFVKLGPIKVLGILVSFFLAKVLRDVLNAEDWVIKNFGKRLYEYFFKVYNEKIWGIPCSDLSPNWSGQRIKASLFKIL